MFDLVNSRHNVEKLKNTVKMLAIFLPVVRIIVRIVLPDRRSYLWRKMSEMPEKSSRYALWDCRYGIMFPGPHVEA